VQAYNTDYAPADRGNQNPTAAGLPNTGQSPPGNSRLGRVAQFAQQRCYRRTITLSGIADCDFVRRTSEIRRRRTAARLLNRHGPL